MDEAKHEIAGELDSDERLLWSGMPRQGIVLRGSDVFLVPFSLLWGGFALFWEAMAIYIVATAPDPAVWAFPLFGLPFVAVGLYLLLGRFLVDARARAKTYYGVTSKRIMVVAGMFSRRVSSLDLRTLTDVSLTERSNRTGTITFGPLHPLAWMYGGMPWPGMVRMGHSSLELIEEARSVYKIIREAKEALDSGTK
jgi:hypothetical protein